MSIPLSLFDFKGVKESFINSPFESIIWICEIAILAAVIWLLFGRTACKRCKKLIPVRIKVCPHCLHRVRK